jgi:glucose/arabinose dehydrogenase
MGKSWPKEYDRQLIIAEHGSVDRSTKIGYRLVTVKLDGAGARGPFGGAAAAGWGCGGGARLAHLTWAPRGRVAD